MAGIRVAPIEVTSATAEPETPPNSIEDRTVIWASPPGSRPTTTSDRRTRRMATPPLAISTPVKTKKITASSGKELMPTSMRWTIVTLSITKMLIAAAAEAIPIANAIGMPISSSTANTPNRITMVIGQAFGGQAFGGQAFGGQAFGGQAFGAASGGRHSGDGHSGDGHPGPRPQAAEWPGSCSSARSRWNQTLSWSRRL